jgi:hypothetical protein
MDEKRIGMPDRGRWDRWRPAHSRFSTAVAIILLLLALVGFAELRNHFDSASNSATPASPAFSASTPCPQWLEASLAERETFVRDYWYTLPQSDVAKVVEIKDAGCRSAGVDSEPGKSSETVGAFQPLVNEVYDGTYGGG